MDQIGLSLRQHSVTPSTAPAIRPLQCVRALCLIIRHWSSQQRLCWVQTAAEGVTAEEAKQINKSLSALGNVRPEPCAIIP